MTNKEAIELLDNLKGMIEDNQGNDYDEALKMGMKGLEQEYCEDAISRNAIIKTLNKMDRYVADELTLCDTERKFPPNEVFIVDDVYEEIVEQLPSVQPKQRWIPVSENLPERWQLVNITIKDYDESLLTGVGYYRGNDDGTWFITAGDGEFLAEDEVIAWMPLPESYRVEREDKECR